MTTVRVCSCQEHGRLRPYNGISGHEVENDDALHQKAEMICKLFLEPEISPELRVCFLTNSYSDCTVSVSVLCTVSVLSVALISHRNALNILELINNT